MSRFVYCEELHWFGTVLVVVVSQFSLEEAVFLQKALLSVHAYLMWSTTCQCELGTVCLGTGCRTTPVRSATTVWGRSPRSADVTTAGSVAISSAITAAATTSLSSSASMWPRNSPSVLATSAARLPRTSVRPTTCLRLLITILYRYTNTVFLPIEVAPPPLQYRPPPVRSRIKPENFILKAIAYHIPSDIGREITTKKTYKPRPVFEEMR